MQRTRRGHRRPAGCAGDRSRSICSRRHCRRCCCWRLRCAARRAASASSGRLDADEVVTRKRGHTINRAIPDDRVAAGGVFDPDGDVRAFVLAAERLGVGERDDHLAVNGDGWLWGRRRRWGCGRFGRGSDLDGGRRLCGWIGLRGLVSNGRLADNGLDGDGRGRGLRREIRYRTCETSTSPVPHASPGTSAARPTPADALSTARRETCS